MITGQFKNINDELITVQIQTTGETITIGENGIYFADEPVVIEWEMKDLFEIIICKSATINLITNRWLGNLLFSNNARNIPVVISKGNEILFDGFLSPNTYNQPFVSDIDTIELQAIDYLSTLKYYKYKNTTAANFTTNKQTANNVQLISILNGIFPNKTIYCDRSKAIEQGLVDEVFDDISLNENIFYGEDADDVKSDEEVLESFLKYLNLHIIQQGSDFYIFDLDSLSKNELQWVNVNTKTITTVNNTISAITKDSFASSDTNLSIDDVYNQISLSDELEPIEVVIESPLSNSNLTPLYSGKQKYMTEFISNGNGDSAIDAFNAAVKGQNIDYDGFKTIDWYFQVMQNPKWRFNIGNNQTIEDKAETNSSGEYINQYKIPLYLKQNQCKPALIRFGSVTTEGGITKDDTPQSKIKMKDYLFISVNGDEQNTSGYSPTQSTLQISAPLIEYIDNTSGGAFSPPDSKTTNYLVFSGKILLQPIAYESSTSKANRNNNYKAIRNGNAPKSESSHPLVPRYYGDVPAIMQNNLVSNDYDDDGRYYTRKFYNTTNVRDETSTYMNVASLQPWTDNKGEQGYEYQYSAVGDSSDRFKKLPVLECELIIGDKRLIESSIDASGNSTFQWVTVGQEPTIDGQVKTTFSLGFNPAIGDKIIGQEYNIQNTISYQLNLDVEGTAIPITREDAINGQVQFRILGLVNTLWNEITRRHPSFWRHTQWSTDSKPILAHVENVIIEDFECKLYSDNALNSNDGSDELIYTSTEQNTFLNVKDDIKFDVITQLTSDECLAKGITTAANLNAAIRTSDGLTLHDIFNQNRQETDVPEKHYLDQYYRKYSSPKLLLELSVWGNGNFYNRYSWSQLNKNFFIVAQEQNLKMNITKYKLREND